MKLTVETDQADRKMFLKMPLFELSDDDGSVLTCSVSNATLILARRDGRQDTIDLAALATQWLGVLEGAQS